MIYCFLFYEYDNFDFMNEKHLSRTIGNIQLRLTTSETESIYLKEIPYINIESQETLPTDNYNSYCEINYYLYFYNKKGNEILNLGVTGEIYEWFQSDDSFYTLVKYLKNNLAASKSSNEQGIQIILKNDPLTCFLTEYDNFSRLKGPFPKSSFSSHFWEYNKLLTIEEVIKYAAENVKSETYLVLKKLITETKFGQYNNYIFTQLKNEIKRLDDIEAASGQLFFFVPKL